MDTFEFEFAMLKQIDEGLLGQINNKYIAEIQKVMTIMNTVLKLTNLWLQILTALHST